MLLKNIPNILWRIIVLYQAYAKKQEYYKKMKEQSIIKKLLAFPENRKIFEEYNLELLSPENEITFDPL